MTWTPAQMQGSWAGAMGQSQFMPSSYLAHAVDYDGDGRRDIWSTHADIFASIANYLAQAGWNNRHTWGRQVQLPDKLEAVAAGLEVRAARCPNGMRSGSNARTAMIYRGVALDASLLQNG